MFAASNGDPAAAELVRLGPIRITVEAAVGGVALACRVIAIASVGAVFTLTTDSTRLVDSLVQQARVSPRFAYGALAAYQAIPRFGEDLATLRQARRIRGLRGSWHPRLLIGVLVLAIRHADRMALAMDARAFGSGPRTFFRPIRWSWLDLPSARVRSRSWRSLLPCPPRLGSHGAGRGHPDHGTRGDRVGGHRVGAPPAARAVARCPRQRPRPGTRAHRRHRTCEGPFDAPAPVSGVARQPLGADLTLAQLDTDPYARWRPFASASRSSWVPVLDGWLVTRRDLCIEVMRDAARFTVDDPRFSTAQVVGPSMLSLDGDEHHRHRDPFAVAFLAARGARAFRRARSQDEAGRLVAALAPAGGAEIRRDLAGPLAVERRRRRAGPPRRRARRRSSAGTTRSSRRSIGSRSAARSVRRRGTAVAALGPPRRRHDRARRRRARAGDGDAPPAEVVSNAAVMMFGGIETSEGMTTSLFWHLLTNPEQLAAVRGRSIARRERRRGIAAARARGRRGSTGTPRSIPSSAGASIRAGRPRHRVADGGQSRPGDVPRPRPFDISRPNARSHVAFAQGPHACVGIHLAQARDARRPSMPRSTRWPGIGSTRRDAAERRHLPQATSLPVRWVT